LEVQYRQAFLKDLKQLKSSASYQRIYELAFTTLENINLLEEIPDIKAMRGYNSRYRIRIGDYRIGIEVMDLTVRLIFHFRSSARSGRFQFT
jgi:mRNA interferase RelE/StbE